MFLLFKLHLPSISFSDPPLHLSPSLSLSDSLNLSVTPLLPSLSLSLSPLPSPAIHSLKLSRSHVDWHAVDEVYLYSDATTSKIARTVTQRLGWSKCELTLLIAPTHACNISMKCHFKKCNLKDFVT